MRQPASCGHFTVFVLACFVGYMVVWNVTPVAAYAADERDERDQPASSPSAHLVQIAPPVGRRCGRTGPTA
jgi:NAD(P) transhydrogenase subunit alpha